MPQSFVQKQKFSQRKEQVLDEYDFSGGYVTDKHETKLAPNQSPNVLNTVYNQTGSIKTRNGYRIYNNNAIGTSSDQSNTGTAAGTVAISTYLTYQAQTFVPSGAISMTQINLYMAMNTSGQQQYVQVEIWATSSGLPTTKLTDGTGPIVLVSGTSETAYSFIFRDPVQLSASTTYAIVVKPYVGSASSVAVNQVNLYNTGAAYANGSVVSSTDAGVTWTADTNKDLKFVVYSGGNTPVTGLMRYYDSSSITRTYAKIGSTLYRGNDTTGAMTAITLPSGVTFNSATFLDYIIVNDTMLVIDQSGYIKKHRGSTNADYTTGTISVTNNSATITGSGTSWSTSTNAVAGEYIKLPDGKWYKINTIGSNTSITIETAYQGSTQSGQSYVISPWGEVQGKLNSSTAPSGLVRPQPSFIANYSNRIWVAKGNSLYFSVLDTTGGGEHFNDFDTAQNAGQINVPGGKGDIITGIYTLGNALFVFQRHSIWAVYGSSPASFELRNISNEVGLINRRSLVEFDDILLFLSDNGVYMFDGSNWKNISEGVVNEAIRSFASSGTTVATLWDNKYVLAYTPDGGSYNTEALFYDLSRGVWGRFDGVRFNVFSAWNGGNDDGSLYYGSSSTGNIYKWGVGGNDAGYKIHTLYETPAYGFDANINDKSIKKFYIQQLALGDWDMSVTQISDLGAVTINGSNINLSPGSASLWGVAQWGVDTWSSEGQLLRNRIAEFQGTAEYFKFRIEQTGYDQGVEVLGILLTARARRLT